MSIDPWLTGIRFLGLVIMGAGFFLLAREQRVTVRQGRPARPRFIALWVVMVLGGAGISALAIIAAG